MPFATVRRSSRPGSFHSASLRRAGRTKLARRTEKIGALGPKVPLTDQSKPKAHQSGCKGTHAASLTIIGHRACQRKPILKSRFQAFGSESVALCAGMSIRASPKRRSGIGLAKSSRSSDLVEARDPTRFRSRRSRQKQATRFRRQWRVSRIPARVN